MVLAGDAAPKIPLTIAYATESIARLGNNHQDSREEAIRGGNAEGRDALPHLHSNNNRTVQDNAPNAPTHGHISDGDLRRVIALFVAFPGVYTDRGHEGCGHWEGLLGVLLRAAGRWWPTDNTTQGSLAVLYPCVSFVDSLSCPKRGVDLPYLADHFGDDEEDDIDVGIELLDDPISSPVDLKYEMHSMHAVKTPSVVEKSTVVAHPTTTFVNISFDVI